MSQEDAMLTDLTRQKSKYYSTSHHGHTRDHLIYKNISKSRSMYSRRTLQLFFTFLIYFLIQGPTVMGFNLDVKFPSFVSLPGKNSYFGYSVDMYVGEMETWLLVGAPKSQKRGEVYKCKYEENTQSNCTLIHIVKEDSATLLVNDMFGMTMVAGKGKQLLACSPLFTKETEIIRGDTIIYYDLLGLCYFTDDFTMETPNIYKLIPCQGAKGTYHDGDEHGNCEAGFSAAFTKDGDNILIGATGSFYRQGSIMLQPLPITNDVTDLPMHTGESKPVVPPGWKKNDWVTQSYDDNYLGYGVATGKSIDDAQLLFAGAPRRFGYDLLGMVIVYEDRMDAELYNFTGTQTGEYFGSSLAAADLNGDGLDDIIIGAPLYSDFDKQLAENGRAYVFYQTAASRSKIPEDRNMLLLEFSDPVIIEGEVGNARFGSVISAIGDINLDGYGDIAIGAPYMVNDEDSGKGDGSVFIYNGGKDGLVVPASQEIKGLKLDENLSAFGISVAGQKDVDKNGYPDVFVGAYMSEQAVLIRSRPVIKVISNVNVNPETVNIEEKFCPSGESSTTSCFLVSTCFSYEGVNVPESINLEYQYDIDSMKTGEEKRAFIIDDEPKEIKLNRKTKDKSEVSCVEEYAYLKVDLRDKLTEIVVKVAYSLIELEEPVQPVLNQLEPTYSSFQVKLFKDCGEDDICQADLKVQTILDQETIYVGQEWPIVLQEVVTNHGESAFLSMLYVEIPKYVYYVGVQDKVKSSGLGPLCTSVDNFVICEIGNPMKRGAAVNVNLKFQTSGLHGNISELTFKSFVNCTNLTNNTSNMDISPLAVAVKSNIAIFNTSSPDNIFLKDSMKDEKIAKNRTEIIHTYQVSNGGPSDISAGTIVIEWPLRTNDGRDLLELIQVIEYARIDCEPVKKGQNLATENNITSEGNHYFCDGRAQCDSITCTVGHLRRKEEITFEIHFALPYNTVLQNELDSYLRSEFSFKVDEYPYAINPGPGPLITSSITTEVKYIREPEPKEVQWWIIAIAVTAGVLVLLLLIFILWRCGFFVRKKHPEGGDPSQKEKLNPNGIDEDASEMEQYLK